MDEFEKIKTFSESLAERQQKMNETPTPEKPEQELNLPQYLSQFRAVPVQEEKEAKRVLWIVLGLCVVLVGSVVFALTVRLPQMEEDEIVVISPTPTPVKVLPDNPGGLNIPDRDKVVYERATEAAPAPVVESLFPETEQPLLPEEVIEPESKEEVILSPQEDEAVVIPLVEEGEVNNEPVEVVTDENGTVRPEQDEVVLENSVEEVIPAVPEQKPEEAKETKEPKKESVPAPKPAKKVEGPVWRAQLLSSASKAKVESSWKQISQKQKALLSDMPYQIISATIPGKGSFWRLQVGEFATKEMATNLCA